MKDSNWEAFLGGLDGAEELREAVDDVVAPPAATVDVQHVCVVRGRPPSAIRRDRSLPSLAALQTLSVLAMAAKTWAAIAQGA